MLVKNVRWLVCVKCVCLCVFSSVFMLGILVSVKPVDIFVCVCVFGVCVCVRVQGVFMGTHLAHAGVSMSHLDHRRKSRRGHLWTNKTQDASINHQSRHDIIIIITNHHRGRHPDCYYSYKMECRYGIDYLIDNTLQHKR